MRKLFGRRRASAALGLFLALAVVGGAFAYWTQSGSGSGSASTGTIAAVEVTQTSTPTGMYPGGPALPLAGTFYNPNDGPVMVGTLSAAVHGGWKNTVSGKPDCTADDFEISAPLVINGQIPSGTSAWSGLTIRLVNSATNQDACKNVVVDLDYTLTAAP